MVWELSWALRCGLMDLCLLISYFALKREEVELAIRNGNVTARIFTWFNQHVIEIRTGFLDINNSELYWIMIRLFYAVVMSAIWKARNLCAQPSYPVDQSQVMGENSCHVTGLWNITTILWPQSLCLILLNKHLEQLFMFETSKHVRFGFDEPLNKKRQQKKNSTLAGKKLAIRSIKQGINHGRSW